MNQNWIEYIKQQKVICDRLAVNFVDAAPELFLGIADNVKFNTPIHGLRHPLEKGTTGWFIWAGDYSDRDDFF